MKKMRFVFVIFAAIMIGLMYANNFKVKASNTIQSDTMNSIDENSVDILSSGSSGSDHYWENTGLSLPKAVDYGDGTLLKYLKRGDILYQAKGFTGHAAIVEGIYYDETYNQYYVRVIESIPKGGVCRGIITPDRIQARKGFVYRLTNATEQQIEGAFEFIYKQLGESYQLATHKNELDSNSNWYCSELIWAAFYHQGIYLDVDDNKHLGSIVTPKELINHDFVVLIADYIHSTTSNCISSTMHTIECGDEILYDQHHYIPYSGYTDICYCCGILSTENTLELKKINLNCHSDPITNSTFCDKGQYLIYEFSVDCEKSYTFNISTFSSMEILLYNSNQESINNVIKMSNDGCTAALSEYLLKGTYYLKIKFKDIEASANINITIQPTWKSTGTEVLNGENNIINHLHENEDNEFTNLLYYINTTGAGMYKFTLTATKSNGSCTYPTAAVKVYDHNNINEEYKYDVMGYSELAQNRNGENSFYMYLSRNGYFYIRINMPNASYTMMNLEIEPVDNYQDITINDRMIDAFTDELFREINTNDYAKSFTIDRPIKAKLKGNVSGIISNNITFILFKTMYNTQTRTYYTIDKYVKKITSTDSELNQEIILEPGTYYIGYFGNSKGANIDVSIQRLIQNNPYASTTIVADPGAGYTYGSEVRYNKGLYNGNTITEGFTRHLYFVSRGGILPSFSRVQYAWYSSNNNIATVTRYGTVLAQNVNENKDVSIYAIYNNDPSIIFVKSLRVLKETSTEEIVININASYSFVSENGKYKLPLNDNNCPYPWVQDYNWSVYIPDQENDITCSVGIWGEVSASRPGNAIITSIYTRNPRVTIIIYLVITE